MFYIFLLIIHGLSYGSAEDSSHDLVPAEDVARFQAHPIPAHLVSIIEKISTGSFPPPERNSDGFFECLVPTCAKSFRRQSAFTQHIERHDSKFCFRYRCPVCYYGYNSITTQNDHAKDHSKAAEEESVLQLPKQDFKRISPSLEGLLIKRNSLGFLTCPAENCPFTHGSEGVIRKHYAHHTECYALECHLCSYRADGKSAMAKHIKSHETSSDNSRINKRLRKIEVVAPKPSVPIEMPDATGITSSTPLPDIPTVLDQEESTESKRLRTHKSPSVLPSLQEIYSTSSQTLPLLLTIEQEPEIDFHPLNNSDETEDKDEPAYFDEDQTYPNVFQAFLQEFPEQ